MRKKPEVTEATRTAIIGAFCLLSKEKPFGKITVQEIASKAGYNRCTFYQYFEDIYDLLDYIENIVLSRIKENFEKNITHDNFSQTFLEAFTRIHKEQAAYFDILLSPANRTHFTEKLMTDVLPIFMERFRLPAKHAKSKYYASMYFATVVSAIAHWLHEERALPLDEFSKILGNVLTNGVMTEITNFQSSIKSKNNY